MNDKPLIPHYGYGDPLPEVETQRFRKKGIVTLYKMRTPFTCTNAHGQLLQGRFGDFLCQDIDGGFYPLMPDYVAEHYEVVEDGS